MLSVQCPDVMCQMLCRRLSSSFDGCFNLMIKFILPSLLLALLYDTCTNLEHAECQLNMYMLRAAKRGAFEMYEAQVHEELSQLVGDSGALHKFLEAALRLECHAFDSALGPVSPSLVHLTETTVCLLPYPPTMHTNFPPVSPPCFAVDPVNA